ncbi:MAG TPA: NTP transferase domain-containing protein [Sedimentisphaerales bacterium]|nr:NTP transferase domain-containing protein [Sedimentisphaerales bacterium]
MAERVAIILAAGVSSRMNTQQPKVLHEVCGRSMLAYVLDACRAAEVGKIYVVAGYGAEQVKSQFDGGDIVWVHQDQQRGTGHAVLCCKDYLKDFNGQTLVLCGDGPLIRAQTLRILAAKHDSEAAATTLATAILEEPGGYGRIIRDSYGNIQGIVEDHECTEVQKKIREVNPSYYLFDNQVLFEALSKITCENAKNEYYLTDALSIILSSGRKVVAVTAVRPEEAMSINSRADLSRVGKIMQQRIQEKLMANGVTIVDPDNTWIEAGAQIGQDTQIEPFTYVQGEVKIGMRCNVGPFAYLKRGTILPDDSQAGADITNCGQGNP